MKIRATRKAMPPVLGGSGGSPPPDQAPRRRPSYGEMVVESVIVGRVVREHPVKVPLEELRAQLADGGDDLGGCLRALESEGLVEVDEGGVRAGLKVRAGLDSSAKGVT